MSTPAPTTPGAPPSVPSSNSPVATFDTMWDAVMTWLTGTLWPYLVAVATSTAANAAEAEAASTTATAQATAATAAAGAVAWVSGTNYPAYASVYSPITLQSYRTATAGISTVDPSIDDTRWTRIGASGVPDFILHAQGVI